MPAVSKHRGCLLVFLFMLWPGVMQSAFGQYDSGHDELLQLFAEWRNFTEFTFE